VLSKAQRQLHLTFTVIHTVCESGLTYLWFCGALAFVSGGSSTKRFC